MKTVTKKLKPILIIISFAVAAILAAAVYLSLNWEMRYIVSDTLMSFGKNNMPQKSEPDAVEISVSELISDPRANLSQAMMLINTDRLLDPEFSANISEYKDTGVYMNSCAVEAYGALSENISELFDEKLFVSSSYRTAEEQQRQILEEGELAQKVGASEHQAGLGIDVYVRYYAGSGFLKHDAGKWINTNCSDFGFIIRYPYYGKKETGIDFEPWHIRYVGQPHAKIISQNRMTLEGYFEMLGTNEFYSWDSDGQSWLVIRSDCETLSAPKEFISAEISNDNCGGYVCAYRIK